MATGGAALNAAIKKSPAILKQIYTMGGRTVPKKDVAKLVEELQRRKRKSMLQAGAAGAVGGAALGEALEKDSEVAEKMVGDSGSARALLANRLANVANLSETQKEMISRGFSGGHMQKGSSQEDPLREKAASFGRELIRSISPQRAQAAYTDKVKTWMQAMQGPAKKTKPVL